MKRLLVGGLAALATLAACSGETPTGTSELSSSSSEIVVTEGAPTPVRAPRPLRPSLSVGSAAVDVGGSTTTPLSLKPSSCEPTGREVVVTYSVKNNQQKAESFQLNSRWEFNGISWSGSVPVTVNVPAQAGGTTNTFQATVTVINGGNTGSGTSAFSIVPFNVSNNGNPGLNMNDAAVTVNVAFAECPVSNTPPTLVVPADITAEATSSSGAVVNFSVTATDLEDGDLTSSVSCDHDSGDTFPLGTTTVTCEVTDNGGLKTTDSFKITVEDTTPAYFTAFPSSTVNLIAADITGAVLDISSLGITVADVGGVSEPSTFSCDYVAGTKLGIGTTTTVSCTAKDAIGNESAASTFDVFVGLNLGGSGFLPPLRMASPYSVHKRGSTVPHKFYPPTYADGTPAIDLAADLRLVVVHTDGSVDGDAVEANDYTAGSTAWRYDPTAGQYVFNLKTGTSSPWDIGTWRTMVSYKGIVLAQTWFDLKR